MTGRRLFVVGLLSLPLLVVAVLLAHRASPDLLTVTVPSETAGLATAAPKTAPAKDGSLRAADELAAVGSPPGAFVIAREAAARLPSAEMSAAARVSPVVAVRTEVAFLVHDAEEMPVTGVVVQLNVPLADLSRNTDGVGRAVFRELPPGRYAYHLRAPGRAELTGAAFELAAGEVREWRIRLSDPQLRIRGRVLDTAGVPVPGVVVLAKPYRPAADPSRPGRAGRYQRRGRWLRAFGPRRWRARASCRSRRGR